MSGRAEALQNEFLNALRKDHVPVSVFVIDGIRLAGHIQSLGPYSMRLHGPIRSSY